MKITTFAFAMAMMIAQVVGTSPVQPTHDTSMCAGGGHTKSRIPG